MASAEKNFGRVSSLDDTLYTSSRPGGPDEALWKAGAIKKADVAEWAVFMKGKGVTHAVGLLNPDELDHYEPPGLVEMLKELGITYTATTIQTPGAADTIMAAFRAAEAQGEKAVTHCLGGGGRAPTAAGLWLVEKHGLSPEAGVQAIEEANVAAEVVRHPDAAKIAALVANKQSA